MPSSPDQQFDAFIALRDRERDAKRARDHGQVVAIVQEILALAQTTPSLHVATEFFWKDLAMAYRALGDRTSALFAYQRAREAMCLSRVRATHDQVPDWDRELTILDRKIQAILKT